jgi:hypothetical protein
MKTTNTIVTNENANVLDYSMLFAYVINETSDNYNAIVDSTLNDARACRDDYLHIYRHDTTNAQNRAHNNVFQCYLKNKKQCVNILCNKVNFDAFTSDIQHEKQYKNSSLIRFVVAYDEFIQFMQSLIQYDNMRATTSATKEAQAIAQ